MVKGIQEIYQSKVPRCGYARHVINRVGVGYSMCPPATPSRPLSRQASGKRYIDKKSIKFGLWSQTCRSDGITEESAVLLWLLEFETNDLLVSDVSSVFGTKD
jgi:hypothetical protein